MHKEIVSDLLLEVQYMQQLDKPIDVRPLEIEIDNLNRKKRDVIDLMLEKFCAERGFKIYSGQYDQDDGARAYDINIQYKFGNKKEKAEKSA